AFDVDTPRFLMVNDAAIHRYGSTRDEFLELTLTDIRPPEDHEQLREDIARRHDAPRLWRHLTKHRETLIVEITAHDLEFEGKRARLVLANDVTVRQRLEDQLRQSQKMEAIRPPPPAAPHPLHHILSPIL